LRFRNLKEFDNDSLKVRLYRQIVDRLGDVPERENGEHLFLRSQVVRRSRRSVCLEDSVEVSVVHSVEVSVIHSFEGYQNHCGPRFSSDDDDRLVHDHEDVARRCEPGCECRVEVAAFVAQMLPLLLSFCNVDQGSSVRFRQYVLELFFECRELLGRGGEALGRGLFAG
jgi:hypothetical protein